ncbi:hypothetical protein DXA97_11785 [Clostridium sp. OF09-36]|uniref:hypothetical protein n=1 Tax=Clostridium sp. OF09-36 TaxID=2292310 RepID=UPI000E4BA089|nr:hypothetical protein [Clostridium sp. OF09-36]RHV86924.1 hypothetical protein DXA97_11785 [Clostridium sp. OF09-36]
MTKLNFIQAKHQQALSYAVVQSDPAEPAPEKTLSDRLGDLAVDVMVVAAAFCGATGFMFWLFIILALA